MWYTDNGVPEYFSRAVRDVLNIRHDRWICRGGPIAWPPRSPHFNPLDFYLWGHLKTLMNAAPVDNKDEFHLSMDACQTIRIYPGIFQRMQRSIMRRVERCTEFHAGRFEHLL
jgi:hypothetical protein